MTHDAFASCHAWLTTMGHRRPQDQGASRPRPSCARPDRQARRAVVPLNASYGLGPARGFAEWNSFLFNRHLSSDFLIVVTLPHVLGGLLCMYE